MSAVVYLPSCMFWIKNILFTVTLTYYDIELYMHTIFIAFGGKCHLRLDIRMYIVAEWM